MTKFSRFFLVMAKAAVTVYEAEIENCRTKAFFWCSTPTCIWSTWSKAYNASALKQVCDGGWLSALDVEAGTIWQVNEAGEVRHEFH